MKYNPYKFVQFICHQIRVCVCVDLLVFKKYSFFFVPFTFSVCGASEYHTKKTTTHRLLPCCHCLHVCVCVCWKIINEFDMLAACWWRHRRARGVRLLRCKTPVKKGVKQCVLKNVHFIDCWCKNWQRGSTLAKYGVKNVSREIQTATKNVFYFYTFFPFPSSTRVHLTQFFAIAQPFERRRIFTRNKFIIILGT